ncbi:hypothetical protein RRG08_012251 [Elysia crispata]|uniref:Uncharacterized protein n=1 Tax=Elysia crispata TaxID=231223 RepID=A0AAE1CMY0_9GAST|nr:hypothetical protein RRG08_012251 [Elysia crispata]
MPTILGLVFWPLGMKTSVRTCCFPGIIAILVFPNAMKLNLDCHSIGLRRNFCQGLTGMNLLNNDIATIKDHEIPDRDLDLSNVVCCTLRLSSPVLTVDSSVNCLGEYEWSYEFPTLSDMYPLS